MNEPTSRLTVELDEQTLRLLRAGAQENAQSIDELVQAAIVAYIRNLSTLPRQATEAEERRAVISREAAAWRALPEEERRRYGSVYVAVHNGQVVDTDADRSLLLHRVRRQYARQPILITPAAANVPREFSRIGIRRS